MNSTTMPRAALRLPARLFGFVRDLAVGTLLCLSPITAILALGWITRRMQATIFRRWYGDAIAPGWVFGLRERGWIAWLLGGLAANIRAGVLALLGLLVLTLPFTLAWLGAWWAGWENSFNKGYEQAGVGPMVWAVAALGALPILAHLPLALAHAAVEDRFGAFFEWGRIRSVAASAGARLVWLALLSAAFSLPILGLRAVPVFVEDVVPGFADMAPAAQADVANGLALAMAGLAFLTAALLRHRAAVIYARAAPRAATGRFAPLWDTHAVKSVPPSGRTPGRAAATIWLILAALVWALVPALMVAGQFMNHDAVMWLTHPVFLLPWGG